MKKVNFGIIGFGYFGKFHAKVLKDIKGANLVGVADRNPKNICEPVKGVKRFLSADDLLRDDSIESVIIATPPSTHLSLMVKAAQFKKNIFVEKPLVTSSAELKKFKKIFGSYKKCFMLGHIYLYNEFINKIKKVILSGVIGRVRLIKFNQGHLGPIRGGVDCLMEIGTHQISILDYLFGPRELKIKGAMKSSIKKNSNGDAVFVGLTYDGDIDVHINLSWYSPEKEKKMIFIGDKGIIIFDDVSKKLLLWKIKYPKTPIEANQSFWFDSGKGPIDLFGGRSAYNPQKAELEHFIRCSISGKQPISGFDHAIRTANILNKISAALKKSK